MRLLPQLALASVAFLGGVALHSQFTAGNPQSLRIPQFDNDAVKVWKSVVLPKQPLSLHRHDHPRVVVALTGGTMNFVDSSGTREEAVWEAGKAYWLPSMPPGAMHADVNVGEKPVEVMLIELEKAQ